MRLKDAAETIKARADALRPFLGISGEDRLTSLRRMLRHERRAARSGSAMTPPGMPLRRLIDEARQAST